MIYSGSARIQKPTSPPGGGESACNEAIVCSREQNCMCFLPSFAVIVQIPSIFSAVQAWSTFAFQRSPIYCQTAPKWKCLGIVFYFTPPFGMGLLDIWQPNQSPQVFFYILGFCMCDRHIFIWVACFRLRFHHPHPLHRRQKPGHVLHDASRTALQWFHHSVVGSLLFCNPDTCL